MRGQDKHKIKHVNRLGGYCQNLCDATRFCRFGQNVRTTDQQITVLEMPIHWDSEIFKIRGIGATGEKVLRQKPKI